MKAGDEQVRAGDGESRMSDGEVRVGFERKYIVPETLLPALQDHLQTHLTLDPYASADGIYTVTSLYLDSTNLSSPSKRWRIRRYNEESRVFAEVKEKPQPGHVVKRRVAFPLQEIAHLTTESTPSPWFTYEMHAYHLAPVCLVRSVRQAFVGSGGVRVTVDTQVEACLAQGFSNLVFSWGDFHLSEGQERVRLVEGCLLELKFARETLPSLSLLEEDIASYATPFSKYESAQKMLGMPVFS
jgi:hypothetical protein